MPCSRLEPISDSVDRGQSSANVISDVIDIPRASVTRTIFSTLMLRSLRSILLMWQRYYPGGIGQRLLRTTTLATHDANCSAQSAQSPIGIGLDRLARHIRQFALGAPISHGIYDLLVQLSH